MASEKQRVEERIKRTEKILDSWESKGYTVTEKTISIILANILAIIVCLPLIAVEYYLFTQSGGTLDAYWSSSFIETAIMLAIYCVFVYIHEVIHWIFMGLFAGSWDNVQLGFNKQVLTPYCTCQEPLKRWQYVVSLLMPTIIIGFGGTFLSILLNNGIIFVIALLHTLGGAGDILIFFILMTHKKRTKEIFVIDHPTKCGYYAVEGPNTKE